jgi:transcriptional regulator with XRE-family HTH domain
MNTTADTTCIALDLEKVKRLRDAKGLSMAEAANRAGLKSRYSWWIIESGKSANVTLSTLDGIAKALGVNPKSLLK